MQELSINLKSGTWACNDNIINGKIKGVVFSLKWLSFFNNQGEIIPHKDIIIQMQNGISSNYFFKMIYEKTRIDEFKKENWDALSKNISYFFSEEYTTQTSNPDFQTNDIPSDLFKETKGKDMPILKIKFKEPIILDFILLKHGYHNKIAPLFNIKWNILPEIPHDTSILKITDKELVNTYLDIKSINKETKCAKEGEKCNCQGLVKYGDPRSGIFSDYKYVNPSIMCNNSVFGDPVHRTPKVCMCKTNILEISYNENDISQSITLPATNNINILLNRKAEEISIDDNTIISPNPFKNVKIEVSDKIKIINSKLQEEPIISPNLNLNNNRTQKSTLKFPEITTSTFGLKLNRIDNFFGGIANDSEDTLNDDDLDKYITDRRKLEKEIRDDELSIKNEKLKEIKLKKEKDSINGEIQDLEEIIEKVREGTFSTKLLGILRTITDGDDIATQITDLEKSIEAQIKDILTLKDKYYGPSYSSPAFMQEPESVEYNKVKTDLKTKISKLQNDYLQYTEKISDSFEIIEENQRRITEKDDSLIDREKAVTSREEAFKTGIVDLITGLSNEKTQSVTDLDTILSDIKSDRTEWGPAPSPTVTGSKFDLYKYNINLINQEKTKFSDINLFKFDDITYASASDLATYLVASESKIGEYINSKKSAMDTSIRKIYNKLNEIISLEGITLDEGSKEIFESIQKEFSSTRLQDTISLLTRIKDTLETDTEVETPPPTDIDSISDVLKIVAGNFKSITDKIENVFGDDLTTDQIKIFDSIKKSMERLLRIYGEKRYQEGRTAGEEKIIKASKEELKSALLKHKAIFDLAPAPSDIDISGILDKLSQKIDAKKQVIEQKTAELIEQEAITSTQIKKLSSLQKCLKAGSIYECPGVSIGPISSDDSLDDLGTEKVESYFRSQSIKKEVGLNTYIYQGDIKNKATIVKDMLNLQDLLNRRLPYQGDIVVKSNLSNTITITAINQIIIYLPVGELEDNSHTEESHHMKFKIHLKDINQSQTIKLNGQTEALSVSPEPSPAPGPEIDSFTGETINEERFIIIDRKPDKIFTSSGGKTYGMYRINVYDYLEDLNHISLLKSFHNKYLVYDAYDFERTNLSKIKQYKITTGSDPLNKILIKIRDNFKKNNSIHPKFTDIYLNEHCNICLLSNQGEEFRYQDGTDNQIRKVRHSADDMCPLFPHACYLESTPINGLNYKLELKTHTLRPRNRDDEEKCNLEKSQKLLNLETFANLDEINVGNKNIGDFDFSVRDAVVDPNNPAPTCDDEVTKCDLNSRFEELDSKLDGIIAGLKPGTGTGATTATTTGTGTATATTTADATTGAATEPALTAQITTMNDTLSTLKTKLNTLDNLPTNTNLNAKLSGLQDEFQRKLNTLKTNLDAGSTTRISQLQTQINAKFQQEISKQQGSIDSLTPGISSSVRNNLQTFKGELNNLIEGKLNDILGPAISGLQTEQIATQARPAISPITGTPEGINKELLDIINKITQGYVDFNNKQVIQTKLDNLELMIKNLESGGSSNQTTFLKKLLLMSQLQMNNALTKLGNQPRNHLENPSLPGITQFKPSGASNIFSPLIDIRTSDSGENDKFSDAYEKGFKEGMGKKSGDRIHFDYGTEETKINQTITDSYKSADKDIVDIDDSVIISAGSKNNKATQNNQIEDLETQYQEEKKNNSNNSNKNSRQKNGYTRGNNDKLGIPGYSYLHPQHFDVPQQRAPICHQIGNPPRGGSAMEPAGYLSSGHSNVMEFHEVGAILPKFQYKEDRNYKKDNTNNY